MPRRTTPDPFAQQIGARIRELRFERNMSIAELADASDLSRGHLSRVEHGLVVVTLATLDRIAQSLQVPPLYLLVFPGEDERADTAEILRKLPAKQVRKLREQLRIDVGPQAPERSVRKRVIPLPKSQPEPRDLREILLSMPNVGEDKDFERPLDLGREDEPWDI